LLVGRTSSGPNHSEFNDSDQSREIPDKGVATRLPQKVWDSRLNFLDSPSGTSYSPGKIIHFQLSIHNVRCWDLSIPCLGFEWTFSDGETWRFTFWWRRLSIIISRCRRDRITLRIFCAKVSPFTMDRGIQHTIW
jgi:hypothetical protein